MEQYIGPSFNVTTRSRKGLRKVEPAEPHSDVPDSIDWRKKGYVTPVKAQGECISCYAFSVLATVEAYHFGKTGKLVSLSAQNLVDCVDLYNNDGCHGGYLDDTFTGIVENGVATEESYPYTAKEGNCSHKKDNATVNIEGFGEIWREEELVQKAVGTVSISKTIRLNVHI